MPPAYASPLLAALLTACSAPAPPTGLTPTTAAATLTPPPRASEPAVNFTSVGDGLSARLVVPPGPHKFLTTVELGLELRNDGPTERRIYLIGTPTFRAMQSDLEILGPDGRAYDRQPDPHPHGYVVSEADFPAIAPGAIARFTQPLFLDPKLGANVPGDLQVRWTYHNTIESWAGGAQTLDGVTKPLFGGGRIPGIWLGNFSLAAPLPVIR